MSSFLLFFLFIVVVTGWGILRGGGYWIIISVNCIDPGAGHTLNVVWVLMPRNHIRFCYLDFTVTFIELNNFNLTLAKTGFPWIVEVKREAERGWVERESFSNKPIFRTYRQILILQFLLGFYKMCLLCLMAQKKGIHFFLNDKLFKRSFKLLEVSNFILFSLSST